MEESSVKAKIQLLEDELEKIKKTLPSEKKPNLLVAFLRRANKLISSYQSLITMGAALLTVMYIFFIYGIGPFESYNNISRTRKLSEFYRRLGDKMMQNMEYPDAEAAYKSALTLQANNTESIYGLTKAQIFTPTMGQKYTDSKLIDLKLEYLRSLFPEDADISFLKCLNFESADNNSEAKKWCEDAIHLNEDAYSPYIVLGYLCQKEYNFECALSNNEKALEKNPESPTANNNVGEGYLLKMDIPRALKHLERANSLSFNVYTAFALGEAYRYADKLSDAINMHKAAIAALSEENAEKERFAGGAGIVAFMPYEKDDAETIRISGVVRNMTQKKALLYFSLAIDHALQEDFSAAEQDFENGKKYDPDNSFGDLFTNRSVSAIKLLEVSSESKAWLKKYSKDICINENLCDIAGEL